MVNNYDTLPSTMKQSNYQNILFKNDVLLSLKDNKTTAKATQKKHKTLIFNIIK